MKTLKEINREIRRLREEQDNADYLKNKIITAEIAKLEWVKDDSDEIKNKRLKLLKNYNKLTRIQKTAFNALRKYEYKVGCNVTLDMIKSDDFMQEPDLVGFGEVCKKVVIDNPELFLFDV